MPASIKAFSIWSPTTQRSVTGSGSYRPPQTGRISDCCARGGTPGADGRKTSCENIHLLLRHSKPDGIPLEYGEHAQLMFNLMTLALQTDITRISTFMLAREGSNRGYREIGVPEGHHGLSHHRNDPALMDKVAAINHYHMQQFARFRAKTEEHSGWRR